MLFSNQFKSSNLPPLFVPNLKTWYLSKTISFLKCPFVPTFLLIIARRCDQKNGNILSQGPIHLGVFCPHFKSDIRKHSRRSDVKLPNFLFLKQRKNEMKRDENETLCWIMRWGWMTWKWSLAFNNDDGKKLYNLLTKKNKKIKTNHHLLHLLHLTSTLPAAFSLCPCTLPWNRNQ